MSGRPSLPWAAALLFQTTAIDQLAEVVRAFFLERALPVLPDSRLLVLDMAQELANRYTLVWTLVSAENDSGVTTGTGFRAGRALATSEIYGAEPLLAPALGILAPYVYAVPSARSRAAGVWIFGQAAPGAAWPSNQLIDALKISGEPFTGTRQRTGNSRRARPASRWPRS
jgi:hypothetical protein